MATAWIDSLMRRAWMCPARRCGWSNHKATRAKRGIGDVGSLPNGINTMPGKPAWQVANDKVEASRAKLRFGQDAPKGIRPRTRVTRPQSKDKERLEPDLLNPSSRAARAPPKVAR